MKPKDPGTFIDLGASITRLILVASGQGVAASVVGESAGLFKSAKNLLGEPAARAISAERIADEMAARLLHVHPGISEADWHVAAKKVASLIDRLPERDRLAAEYDPKALERKILSERGGKQQRDDLFDPSARQAFDLILEVVCQHIVRHFTDQEALDSLLNKVAEVQTGIQKLLDRPARASITRDVVNNHIDVLRDLAPEVLEDRESEMAALREFVSGSDDVWYAIEADMVSGKTAVMASFASNPPDRVHVVSYFVRRIGGDGNNNGNFAFVVGAQLASILGHEYTENVSEARRPTEFRTLLRQAATACRSEAVPRTLVLVIDGLDEDSYFEKPDAPDAKSILSLLPRSLPEGVKVITASRPNPRLPEDVECDAKRVAVPLKPSPIAEKYINIKDIEKYFKTSVAVDIVAFLAACGDALTVKDLTRLINMFRCQEFLSYDVSEYVDRSPGRILTSVDVGSGDREVMAYRLGHDVVMQAVIRTLDPDSFGESGEPEDLSRVAMIREEVLAPYRSAIREWVKECASRGWGSSAPSYVLSGACFDLMLTGQRDGCCSATTVLDPGRYDEVRRRSGRRSHVLRMIERECLKILDVNRGGLPELVAASVLDAVECRRRIGKMSVYVPGLFKAHMLCRRAAAEDVLEMVAEVDDPKGRLAALREVMISAMESGYCYTYTSAAVAIFESLRGYRSLRDDVLHFLVDMLVSLVGASSDIQGGDGDGVELNGWIEDVLVAVGVDGVLSRSLSSSNDVAVEGEDAHATVSLLDLAEGVAKQIEVPEDRAVALLGVVGAFARAGYIEKAGQVAGNAMTVAVRIGESWHLARVLSGVADVFARTGRIGEVLAVVGQIGDPWQCVQVLLNVAFALTRTGCDERALQVAEDAVSLAEQMEKSWNLAWVLSEVADLQGWTGDTDKAKQIAERVVTLAELVEVPRGCVRLLLKAAAVLEKAGDTDRARQVVEKAVSATDLVETPWERVVALLETAAVLEKAGDTDGARQVVDKAVSTLGQIEAPREYAMFSPEVVRLLVREGDTGRARQVAEMAVRAAEQIDSHQDRARGLSGVTNALARAGRTGQALAVAEQIEEPWERARVLSDTADTLGRAGDTGRARQVAEMAVRTAEQIETPRDHAQVLSEMAGALVRAGMTAKTFAVAERIGEPQERAVVLLRAAGALAGAGQADEALAVAERIGEPWCRGLVLSVAAGALARAGDTGRAQQVAQEAVSAAEQIKDSLVRALVLPRAADVLVLAGDKDRAQQVAEKVVSAAEQIGQSSARDQALSEAADTLARVGDTERARDILAVIDEPSSRRRLQSAIMKALVGKGSSDEAVDVLRSALAETAGFGYRRDAAGSCSTLAATCLEAADLVDADSRTHEQWLGLARSALARSWLYGASVWDRFDVLLRVAPDLAMRLVKERLLADPESGPTPEDPGGEAASSR